LAIVQPDHRVEVEDEEDPGELRERMTELARELAASRWQARQAEQHLAAEREVVRTAMGPLPRPLASARTLTLPAGAGGAGREPDSDLIRDRIPPEELLDALGASGDAGRLAAPIPVDLRGIIDPAAEPELLVLGTGDEPALCRTLCSIVDRASVAVAVTVVTASATPGPVEALLAAMPSLRWQSAAEAKPRSGTHRLRAGEELAWAWPAEPSDGSEVSVAYVLSGLPKAGSGGVISIVAEARGLTMLGTRARICVPRTGLDHAQRLYRQDADRFSAYPDGGPVSDALGDANVVVMTEHTSVPLVAQVLQARPELACCYYVQDYEPLFTPAGSSRSDRATLSYGAISDAVLYAKTHFVRNVVMARHGLHVTKVAPSLEPSLVEAPRPVEDPGRLRIAAMVRPRTPRRRPQATLAALAAIARALGDGCQLTSFGCGESELVALGGPPIRQLRHLGELTPAEVSEQLARTDIFIDASIYQAFGRSGLEAMAHGAVPVLPRFGGVHEYARAGENCVLVDDGSPEEIARVVLELAADDDRRARLASAARATAGQFSILAAAADQQQLFSAALHRRRARLDPTGAGAARPDPAS
jgi:hypothetical protein